MPDAERDTNPQYNYCGQWLDVHGTPNQGVHAFVGEHSESQDEWNPRFAYAIADSAQATYDANHDSAGDHHCLKHPCPWHPGETRIGPLPSTTAHLVDRAVTQ